MLCPYQMLGYAVKLTDGQATTKLICELHMQQYLLLPIHLRALVRSRQL